jgi:hypothetical protein
MAKSNINKGKRWTPAEKKQLRQLAQGNTPTRIIALKLKRTPAGVESQASKQRTSLKPTNQSPYGIAGKKRVVRRKRRVVRKRR